MSKNEWGSVDDTSKVLEGSDEGGIGVLEDEEGLEGAEVSLGKTFIKNGEHPFTVTGIRPSGQQTIVTLESSKGERVVFDKEVFLHKLRSEEGEWTAEE